MKLKSIILVFLTALFAILNSSGAARECQLDNRHHQAMGEAEITFTQADGSQLSLIVKVADTNATRAAGFQYVCESVIAEQPILFLFDNEIGARFHMRNVVAPIDIAFIKKDGSLDSIQNMLPYSIVQRDKPLYSSNGPIVAALEAYPGFFSEFGVNEFTHFGWKSVSEKAQ